MIAKPMSYSFQEMFMYDQTCCGLTVIPVNFGDKGKGKVITLQARFGPEGG